MKTITKTLAVGIIAGTLLFAGCSKDGATGPAGAQGPTGNANVQAQTFTVSPWGQNNIGNTYYYTNLTVPALTASANSSGAIEVFFSSDNGTYWTALPMTQYNPSGTNYSFSFSTGVNLVYVQWSSLSGIVSGVDPNTFFGSPVQIKVVVIPPAH